MSFSEDLVGRILFGLILGVLFGGLRRVRSWEIRRDKDKYLKRIEARRKKDEVKRDSDDK